jgi:hypothetical protein
MPSHFIPFSRDEAIGFVSTNMAFTGEFADWVLGQVSANNAKIFVAHLAPIKMRRNVGPFKRNTRLKFTFSPSSAASLRFKNSEKTPEECRLEDLGEEAIVLVLDDAPDGVKLKVNAGVSGDIISTDNLGDGQPGKQIFIWHFKVIDPAEMVGWYDFLQLSRTAIDVFFSSLFGRHSDFRLMEALTPDAQDQSHSQQPFYDFSKLWKAEGGRDKYDPEGKVRDEIWVDYVGDVGDGWNSTYAIAQAISQAQRGLQSLSTPPPQPCDTERAEVLIFGGDQVYPVANRLNYKQRLVGPYETALECSSSPHPHVFAIPGNHDWYDSLVAFTRLFCQGRWFAGWQTDQSRSYFALKLPGGWWVLGTDVQLSSDIDVPQVTFFKEVAKSIEAGDHVIICTAEPHWYYAKLYGKNDANYNENNLAFFEKKIVPSHAKIVAFVAGDRHHYQRYQSERDHTQKITAGGGGAFMHPTHGEKNVDTLPGGFERQQVFPSKWTSIKLSAQNLFFLFLNFKFGLLTGLVYLLTSWSVKADVSNTNFSGAVSEVLEQLAASPASVFWVLALFIGFVLFTDTHSKGYRLIAGPVHGAIHVLAVFLIGWGATWYSVTPEAPFGSFRQLVTAGVIILIGGWIVGPTIVGVYLFVSLNLFGHHANEAFSALAIQDWKHFLRMKFERDGKLTIYPIAIRQVPRKWKRRADGQTGPGYEADDPKESSKPILIEGPLVFTPKDEKGNMIVSHP